ncbi:MAG: glucose-1-phosphate adenylyltransferase subunit GlgD [Clostridiales bacterium]|nr:glucose-1-phosphate adenylyltransferase subunit GlgD [Roseburia sp.]MDD7635490.1 glucose-1-phosphate adenylyltransferase subunit GlgD [Clostridiales bacterium]MDY4112601.1 glucose-1-phosphate adenylyltransferase subunit GlgD [Roseburia sp.]
MVNSNADALGIIFPNSYDFVVPELASDRSMASIPFASRYRMVDFVLSNMVNCGMDNISLIVRKNYHSLMDHLGYGREWDLARKNRGLNIVPPFAKKSVKVYNGRVEALASILEFLKSQKEKYVILSDANIAMNFDFAALIEAHIKTGADVTLAYTREEVPENLRAEHENNENFYYTMVIEDGRVKQIKTNPSDTGIQNYYMNICIMGREELIDIVGRAYVHGIAYLERDIFSPYLDKLNVQGYLHEGYAARIVDMKSYFRENMKLLEEENLDALFSKAPIYTKIRDDNPTRYVSGAKARKIMAADGCLIEGDVENSILFRGVKIGKGAKVKNCVLMQDTIVEAGADIEYVITDKNVAITANKEMAGNDAFPVYVMKGETV